MQPKPEVIFFLTDGKVNNAEFSVEKVRENRNIPIMTIAFGIAGGAEALEEMSNITGGQYVAITMERIRELYEQEFGAGAVANK